MHLRLAHVLRAQRRVADVELIFFSARIALIGKAAFADAIVLEGVDTRQKTQRTRHRNHHRRQGWERAWRCARPHRDRRGSNALRDSHHAEEPRSILLSLELGIRWFLSAGRGDNNTTYWREREWRENRGRASPLKKEVTKVFLCPTHNSMYNNTE